MALIAFAGRSRSGKNTAADVLVRRCGFTKFSLAHPLQDACAQLIGMSHKQLYGGQRDVMDDSHGSTPRRMLQLLGTDFVRASIADDFWVDRVLGDVRRAGCDFAVVAGVRFQSEVDAISRAGGCVFRLERQLDGDPGRCEEDAEGTGLTGLSGKIVNNGSMTDLDAAVIRCLIDVLCPAPQQALHQAVMSS